jgi:hypothetical protein
MSAGKLFVGAGEVKRQVPRRCHIISASFFFIFIFVSAVETRSTTKRKMKMKSIKPYGRSSS